MTQTQTQQISLIITLRWDGGSTKDPSSTSTEDTYTSSTTLQLTRKTTVSALQRALIPMSTPHQIVVRERSIDVKLPRCLTLAVENILSSHLVAP